MKVAGVRSAAETKATVVFLSTVLIGLVFLAWSVSSSQHPALESHDLVRSAETFYSLFCFSHSVFLAGVVFAGVAFLGVVAEALILVELVHKAVLGGIVVVPMAFAQIAESGPGEPAASSSPQAEAVRSEVQVGLYGGGNGVWDADVFLKQPNGTDLTLKGVPFAGQPYKFPPYYGLRATWWPARSPSLGIMLDYVHAKAISRRHQVVEQSGTRDGNPVPAREPVSATFDKLEYSHGLNFLTINAVYRFRGWHQRLLPYFGAGVGIMVPHTELARRGISRDRWTYRYEVSGLGAQALAGLEWRAMPQSRFHPFTEFKVGYARNYTDLIGGGSVANQLFAHQVAVGATAYLRPPLLIGSGR